MKEISEKPLEAGSWSFPNDRTLKEIVLAFLGFRPQESVVGIVFDQAVVVLVGMWSFDVVETSGVPQDLLGLRPPLSLSLLAYGDPRRAQRVLTCLVKALEGQT